MLIRRSSGEKSQKDHLNDPEMSSDISPESMGFINLLCLPCQSERVNSILDLIEDV